MWIFGSSLLFIRQWVKEWIMSLNVSTMMQIIRWVRWWIVWKFWRKEKRIKIKFKTLIFFSPSKHAVCDSSTSYKFPNLHQPSEFHHYLNSLQGIHSAHHLNTPTACSNVQPQSQVEAQWKVEELCLWLSERCQRAATNM